MVATDVLLVYPPYTYPKKSPPIGLSYIAAVLERAGYSVTIADMSVLGMGYEELRQLLREAAPSLVGISFMTNQYHEAVRVSQTVKDENSDIPVVVGGPHVSAIPREILGVESVDIAVIGEGEETIVELTDVILKGSGTLKDVAGIGYKENGSIHLNQERELIQDLDSLPFPAWHLLPIDRYSVPATGGDKAERVFAVISSRGCPNHCIFCDSHTIFGRTFRGRSAQNIFEELVYLNERFGAKQFDFVDDTLTVDERRIHELCDLITSSGCDFKWMCNARVNTVSPEIMATMRQAGCVRVEFGVESGDPEVLRKIKKGVTLTQIRSAHAMAKDAGLSVGSFVMVGNLGEDTSAVSNTRALLDELSTDDIYIAIATPFPGTELHRMAVANGWLRITDWSRYVTAPTYLPGYEPIMDTDRMNAQEILQAFFYLHSQFAKKKWRTRYGKHFLLNTRFYKDNALNIRSSRDLVHKVRMAVRLVGGHLLHH